MDNVPAGRSGCVMDDQPQPFVAEHDLPLLFGKDAVFLGGDQCVRCVAQPFQRAGQLCRGDLPRYGRHEQSGVGRSGQRIQFRQEAQAQPVGGDGRVAERLPAVALGGGKGDGQFGERERIALGDGEQPLGDVPAQWVGCRTP
ncbi:hypothetical protein DMH26_00650, partial [Streptomyces sp. WAC 05379]